MIDKTAFINHLTGKASQIFGSDSGSPKADVEQHLKAVVTNALSRFELVTREEFDAQMVVLRRTRERLETLEKRVADLESANSEATQDQQET